MTSLLGQSGTSHTSTITALAFSPDGKTVVSAARDGTIRFWDVETRKQIRVIPFESTERRIKFLPCSAFVYPADLVFFQTGSVALTGLTYGISTWSEAEGVKHAPNDPDVINIFLCRSGYYFVDRGNHSIFFNRMGYDRSTERYLGNYTRLNGTASNDDGSMVALWTRQYLILIDTESRRRVWDIEFPYAGCGSFILFSSDGSRLTLGPWGDRIFMIDVATGRWIESSTYFSPSRPDELAGFGKSDHVLITAGTSEQVRIWNTDTLELIAILDDGIVNEFHSQTGWVVEKKKAHHGWISALAVSPDQSLFATGGYDHLIKLWDIDTQRVIGELGQRRNQVSALVFADEVHVVAGYEDGTIRLWSVSKPSVVASCKAHSFSIASLYLQSNRLISFDASGIVRLWRYPDLELEAELSIQENFLISSMGAASESPLVVIAGRNPEQPLHGGDLILWDSQLKQEISRWDGTCLIDRSEEKKYPFAGRIAISRDGSLVATANGDDVWIWDAATAQLKGHHQTRSARYHDRCVSKLTFSSDGEQLAVGTWGYHIHLLCSRTAQIREVLVDLEATSALCFSPDNQRLIASTHYDQRIIAHTAGMEHLRHPLLGHTGPVQCIDFCPDGSMFASGGSDGVIVIWKNDTIFQSFSLNDASG